MTRREGLPPLALGLLAGLALALHGFTRAIDYPQALLLAPAAALLAATRAAWCGPGDRSLGRAWLALLPAPMIFCAGALVAPAVASLAGDVCDPLTGLGFHLAGPWASAATGTAAGLLVAACPLRRVLRVVLAAGLVLLSPLVPLTEFLLGPSVRFYGTFVGLYHGAIYDEAVFLELPYLAFRAWDALGFAALFLGGDVLRRRLGRRWLFAAAAAAVAWAALLHPALNPGFLVTAGSLERQLPAAATCGPFTVHARPGGPAAALASAACRDLAFRLGEQEAALGLSAEGPFHVYLYDGPAHKATVMGAGRTSIARPWQGQIHVPWTAVGTRVLAHELVHVLAAPAARSALGVPVRRGVLPVAGLLEGLAVALEPPRPVATLHDWAAALRREGLAPPLEELLGPAGFWSLPGGKAYTLAGSFVRWLLEVHGAPAILALYGGASFEEACAGNLPALEAAWGAFLDRRPLDEGLLALATFLYERPAVFRKRCPYAVGRCLADAERTLAREGPAAALPRFRRRVAWDPGDPAGLETLARILAAAGQPEDAAAVLARAPAEETLSGPQAAAARLARADVALLAGRTGEARDLLSGLSEEPAGRLWRGEIDERLGLARPPAREEVAGLLGLAPAADRRRQVERLLDGEDPILRCLAATRGLLAVHRPAAADDDADRCRRALPPGDPLACAAATAARFAAWVRADLPAARRWHAVLAGDCATTLGVREEEIGDWERRLAWEAAQP